MFGVDLKSGAVALILLLGIAASPSAIVTGLVLSLIVYTVAIIVFGKKPGWRIIYGYGITLVGAIMVAIMHDGIPYLKDMPIQGAMIVSAVLAAVIYPKRAPDAKLTWIEKVIKHKMEK